MNDKIQKELFEQAFRQSAKTPDSWADSVKEKMKEPAQRRRKMGWGKRRLVVVILIFVLAVPIGVYAGFQLLNPGEVALLMDEDQLAEAFDQNRQEIVTKSEGNFAISLLGLISGNILAQFPEIGDKDDAKTYVALAIQRKDGNPIENYTDFDFYVTPLIEGLDPLQWNAATFNNSYRKIIRDGVLYCIAEWDDFEVFSDRELYVAVIQDQIMPGRDVIKFNKGTGKISENQGYNKVNVLFKINADKGKADKAAAERKIAEIRRKNTDHDRESESSHQKSWYQEVFEDGITFKLKNNGILTGEDDSNIVFSLNFFVGGDDIKSVQLKANNGKLLQPELITKEEFDRMEKKWEAHKRNMTGHRALFATQGRYFYCDYADAKKSIEVDIGRLTADLFGEERIDFISKRAAIDSTVLEICVTKTDGSTVTKKLNCSGSGQAGESEYIFYDFQ